MAELVSLAELARRLGLSKSAIRKHVANGLYQPGRDGTFDVDACRAAWEATTDPDRRARGKLGGQAVSRTKLTEAEPTPGDGAPTRMIIADNALSRARAEVTELKAERERIEIAKKRGTLIAKADVAAACRLVMTTITDRLDGVPAQVAPRVASMTDVAAIERTVREVLEGIRREIAALGEITNGHDA